MQPQRIEIGEAIAQAVALQRAGQFPQAEQLCQAVLQVQPDEPTALHVFGACLLQRGDFAAAEKAISNALRILPDQPAAWVNRGIALHALGRFDEALKSYDRALVLQPRDGIVVWYRARALACLRRDHEALQEYERAGDLLGSQSKLSTERLRVADRILAKSARDRSALAARADVFVAQRQWPAALEAYRTILACHPDDQDALAGLAGACLRLDRPDEALAASEAFLRRDPDDVRVLSNKATALAQLGRYREAVAALDAAIAKDPDDAGLHWNRALYRLVQGEFANAWADFEWRWKRSAYLRSLIDLPEQLWDGTGALQGKTILLHSEQGFGDAIQFARYAPLLAARGARVIIGAHAPLKPVLATIDSVSAVIISGDEMPMVDLHCPLVSLPARFGTTLETIPAKVPYIRADAERLARWSARLGPRIRLRVGLAWSGSPTHEEDLRRSVKLRVLEPLILLPADFFSLSKFVRDEDRDDVRRLGIACYGDELTDFAETAALTSLMDLVISVDTSIAHLAGALAKPVWLLISNPPEWRWMLEREDSPWYPTARIFRQQARGDWAGVVERVRRELERAIDAGGAAVRHSAGGANP